jgi:hypothetical protein
VEFDFQFKFPSEERNCSGQINILYNGKTMKGKLSTDHWQEVGVGLSIKVILQGTSEGVKSGLGLLHKTADINVKSLKV